MVGIQNIVSNSAFYRVTQGTAAQMGIKTSLNSVARPGFILMDDSIDLHTKKFSATKEFLYQGISLMMYLALIVPVFKHGAYALAKNKFFKNEAVFQAFPKADSFKKYYKLGSEQEKLNKLNEISKVSGKTYNRKNITAESEHLANGVIETSSLIGTILGLAVMAPLFASKAIHPMMKSLGFVNEEYIENKLDELEDKFDD